MTSQDLVNPRDTPGSVYVFGTDTKNNKDWQKLSILMQAVPPLKKSFIASSVWTWTHNLGYEPLVEAYDNSGNQVGTDLQHTDVNTVVANHLSNLAGYLLIR